MSAGTGSFLKITLLPVARKQNWVINAEPLQNLREPRDESNLTDKSNYYYYLLVFLSGLFSTNADVN
jgi:hypothetical protein